MNMTLRFVVLGIAQTKGSARAFVPKSWVKKAAAAGTQARAVITNDNPKAKAWAQLIAERAANAMAAARLQPFADGAVVLDVWFYLPRPAKFLTKKYAPVDVPHTTRPDADKILRCAKDALSKVVWHDDAQVIDAYVHKRYVRAGDIPRAEITVRAVTAALPKPIVHPETPLLFGEEVLYGEA